eukprot:8189392-Alexandrium_andersonii.AAC.1
MQETSAGNNVWALWTPCVCRQVSNKSAGALSPNPEAYNACVGTLTAVAARAGALRGQPCQCNMPPLTRL